MDQWAHGNIQTWVRNEESQIRNLSDDYVKFLRLSQHLIHTSAQGLIGVITNSGFIDGVTFRDFRESVISEFNTIKILDLHGHGRRGTRSGGDENVFDIMVGTSISFYAKSTEAKKTLQIGKLEALEL
jgi:predicted helicase